MAYKGVERRKFVRFDYPLFVQYKIVEKASREEVLSSISLHMKEMLDKWDKRGYDKEKLCSSLIKEMRNFSFTKNIGEGGICLVTREKFKPDTLLRVQIYIPTRKEPIEVLAKASWVKNEDSPARIQYRSFLCRNKRDRQRHPLCFSPSFQSSKI